MPDVVERLREIADVAVADLRLTGVISIESVKISSDGLVASIQVKRPGRNARLATTPVDGTSDVELRRKLREELRKQLQMCPLCDALTDDMRLHQDEKGNTYVAYDVDCPKCRRFIMSDVLFGIARRALDGDDASTLTRLPFLSAYARAATTPPWFTTDNWEAIAWEERSNSEDPS